MFIFIEENTDLFYLLSAEGLEVMVSAASPLYF